MAQDREKRTAMLDLLEKLRLEIRYRPDGLSSAKVLAVLATLVADVASEAFTELTQEEN